MTEQEMRYEVNQCRKREKRTDRIIQLIWLVIAVFNLLIGYLMKSTFSYIVGAFILGGVVIMFLEHRRKKLFYRTEDVWMNAYFALENYTRGLLKWTGKSTQKNKSKSTKKKAKKKK